jgi:hypothetical protein
MQTKAVPVIFDLKSTGNSSPIIEDDTYFLTVIFVFRLITYHP